MERTNVLQTKARTVQHHQISLIRNVIEISLHTKKRPGVNLPKETKDPYAENSKPLMKEIKDDTNIWKDRPCS